jgi:prepilin-type processing-associated H-X9-DG protein
VLAFTLASLGALAGGLGIGYFDGHVTEVSVTLGLTLALNFILAALSPRGAWRYPLISALAASTWIWLSASPDNPHLPHTLGSYGALNLVLVLAATAGVAIGAGLRRIPKIAD